MFFILSESDDNNQFIEDLYIEYSPIMLKVALSIVKDEHLAHDVVQTAICKLYDKIPKLKTFDSKYLISYVIATIKNVAIDTLKSVKDKKFVYYIDDFEDYDEHILENAAQRNPEDYVIESEDYNNLIAKIKNLPEKKKNLLYMRYVLDMEYEDISKASGLTLSNVHVLFHRIKKQLLKGDQKTCRK